MYYFYIEPTSPQNLKCSAISSTALSCAWIAPQVQSYYVQAYTLSFRLMGGFDYYPGYGTTLGMVSLQSSALEYSLNDLMPYGGYIVEVETILTPLIGSGFSSGAELMTPDNLFGSITTLNLTYPKGSELQVAYTKIFHSFTHFSTIGICGKF